MLEVLLQHQFVPSDCRPASQSMLATAFVSYLVQADQERSQLSSLLVYSLSCQKWVMVLSVLKRTILVKLIDVNFIPASIGILTLSSFDCFGVVVVV